jgi:ELWxxDGT repeat protein
MLSVNVELLADINATGSSVEGSRSFVEFNGDLYFGADDGVHGQELWKTDGTTVGTSLVADINVGQDGSWPTELTEFNGELYFAAGDEFGDELWKTDGTPAGTVRVADLNPDEADSFPSDFVAWRDELYFSAEDSDGGHLWKTDGEEVFLVSAFGVFNSFPDHLFVYNDELYFSASEGIRGDELWKSDGTDAGTILVAEIFAGIQGSFPQSFFEFNDELYFVAGDMLDETGDVLFPRLYKTDGTENGTVRVADEFLIRDFNSGVWSTTVFAGEIYFTGNDPLQGIELYRTDGTPGGAVRVRDLNGPDHSIPLGLTPYRDELYFSATDSAGREVWKTDGTRDGTVLALDLRQGPAGSFPIEYFEFDDQLYFVADDGSGYELWRTDGSVEGTTRLTDLNVNGDSIVDEHVFARLENDLYFRGTDGQTGFEMWVVRSRVEQLSGDIDGDGRVQFSDFLILSSNFGISNAQFKDGDLDGDGSVQFTDFLILSSNFGQSLAFASHNRGAPQPPNLEGQEADADVLSVDLVFKDWLEGSHILTGVLA